MKSKKNVLIMAVLLIVVAVLLVRVIFDKNFDDLKNLAEWQKNYKIENPDATEEEMDEAFKEGMKGLEEWVNNYKIEHPDATDEEIDQAFKDAWGK